MRGGPPVASEVVRTLQDIVKILGVDATAAQLIQVLGIELEVKELLAAHCAALRTISTGWAGVCPTPWRQCSRFGSETSW